MPLYQVRAIDRDGKTYAHVYQAEDDVDAVDQLHACHRKWRVFRPALARLEAWTYRPGVFDPETARWTSAAVKRIAEIHILKPTKESPR